LLVSETWELGEMAIKQYLRILGIIGLLCVGHASTAAARVVRGPADVANHPRIIRYDVEKDAFLHQHSVVSMVSKNRPGGRHAYSGSRVNQFQFRGKPGRGGIYDALDEYKRSLKLDPRNYGYRRR
jgi:hypothetical protein